MKVKAIRKLVFWLLLNTLGSLEVWVFWAVGEKVGLGKSQRVGIFHKFSLLFFLCVLARIQRRQFFSASYVHTSSPHTDGSKTTSV
jgi:hypothetical protein